MPKGAMKDLAAADEVSRSARALARHRLTLAALTPKRSPASRWLAPNATAARTRTRRSSESGVDMPTGLLPAHSLNHASARKGIPTRFMPLGSRSRQRLSVAAYREIVRMRLLSYRTEVKSLWYISLWGTRQALRDALSTTIASF